MPGAPRSDKTSFGLHLYLEGKYCENPKVPGAQLNINLARATTWFVGVTIYCTFFNNNSPPPRQFLCNKILEKKISDSKGKLIEQIVELKGPGPPGRICTPEMETGRVDRPVGLLVGSRFFDRPVKPVEKPVKFSFLATKRHLSTNRNLYILS